MSTTTYTAADYLEAGYRAETAGDRERAAQYYGYLAEALPDSPEGEAARGGLIRLGLAGRPSVPPEPGPVAPSQAPQAARSGATRGTPPHANGARPPAAAPDGFGRTGVDGRSLQSAASRAERDRIRLADLQRQAPKALPVPAPVAAHPEPLRAPAPIGVGDADEQMRLPEVVARRARELSEPVVEPTASEPGRHRAARLGARLLLVCGWIIVCGGLALAVLVAVGVRGGVMGVMAGLPLGLAVASGMLVSGVALVVLA
ncbi:MAG: hypothetical protein AB7L18_12895, partial [Hyphomicrobiaceae bacterium]